MICKQDCVILCFLVVDIFEGKKMNKAMMGILLAVSVGFAHANPKGETGFLKYRNELIAMDFVEVVEPVLNTKNNKFVKNRFMGNIPSSVIRFQKNKKDNSKWVIDPKKVQVVNHVCTNKSETICDTKVKASAKSKTQSVKIESTIQYNMKTPNYTPKIKEIYIK